MDFTSLNNRVDNGNYSGLDNAWLKLGEEVKQRPADLPRAVAIKAPYIGREIVPKHYCGKMLLPIKEQTEKAHRGSRLPRSLDRRPQGQSKPTMHTVAKPYQLQYSSPPLLPGGKEVHAVPDFGKPFLAFSLLDL